MVETLTFHDYQVLALDLYGHGLSTFPRSVDLSAEVYTNQITELLSILGMMEGVALKTKLTLVGFSMGGFLAAKWATMYPDRVGALVLHSPWTHHLPAAATWTLRHVGVLAMLTGSIISGTFDDCESPPAAISSYLCNLSEHGDWELHLQQLAQMEQLPILLLCGQKEGPFRENAMSIHHRLSNTSQTIGLEVCPGSDHMGWLYGPRQYQSFFQSRLCKFLDEYAPLAHFEPTLVVD